MTTYADPNDQYDDRVLIHAHVDLGNDVWAAEAIDSNGEPVLMLLCADCPAPDQPVTIPAHELLGPLPAPLLARLRSVPLRCGAATGSGHPCRIVVARPGDHCHHHRQDEIA